MLPVLLDISHVPSWLVTKTLEQGTLSYSPILAMTSKQYKDQFKDLTASYGLPYSSHAARHLFASLMKFLNVLRSRISQAMIHDAESSLKPYLHAFTDAEQRVILANPDYFKPLRVY